MKDEPEAETMHAPDLERCYRALDLKPGASVEEMRAAHRLLVNVWHPDRFQHDAELQTRAQEKLKAINLAYAELRKATAEAGQPEPSPVGTGRAREARPLTTRPSPSAPRNAREWAARGWRLTANPGRLRDEADGLAWSDGGNLDRFLEGVRAFREALRLNPRLAESWYGLGIAQLALRQHTQAIEALQSAVRLDHDLAAAWMTLGSAFGERGRFNDAAAAFQEGVRVRPRDPSAWYALGSARMQTGETEPAVVAFRRALELQPDLAEAWHSLGVALAFAGPDGRVEPEEALAAFRQAVRLRPDLAPGWRGLGATLSGLGRHDEAIEALQEAVRLQPDSAESWYSLGVAARYGSVANASRTVREAYARLKALAPDEASRLRELLPYSMRLSLLAFLPRFDRDAAPHRRAVAGDPGETPSSGVPSLGRRSA
jgi:tetratricopeptide (TPR) repeat protein